MFKNDEFFGLHKSDINPSKYLHKSARTGKVRSEQVLLDDPDTGMVIKHMIYPKGDVVPEHYHHCAHGYYVLKGTLHTNYGDWEAGSFVWFKEGSVMIHGGTEDEDVEVLHICNKPFDIIYTADEKAAAANK